MESEKKESIETMLQNIDEMMVNYDSGVSELKFNKIVNVLFGVLFGVLLTLVFQQAQANGIASVYGMVISLIISFIYFQYSNAIIQKVQKKNIVNHWIKRRFLDTLETPTYPLDIDHILKFNGKQFYKLTSEQRIYLIYLLKIGLIRFSEVFGERYFLDLLQIKEDADKCANYINQNRHEIALNKRAVARRIKYLTKSAKTAQNQLASQTTTK